MNESQPTTEVNANGQTPEEAQLMLNAQIAYSIDGLASAAQTLELDGVHPSAVVTASMAVFLQLLCASSLLANRTLEEVHAAVDESIVFAHAYTAEVYAKMKESMVKDGVPNAAI